MCHSSALRHHSPDKKKSKAAILRVADFQGALTVNNLYHRMSKALFPDKIKTKAMTDINLMIFNLKHFSNTH